VRIGRAPDCEIRADERSVSRHHVRIEPGADGHTVRDLGSCNGTRVNDEPARGPRPLRDGDYLRVGDCIFRYLAGDNLEAEYHEEIYRLTVQDPLTRLHNRRALDEYLEREVARSQRHARPLSVVLVDLDRFKAVNDTYGHLCGDAVLRDLADRLRADLRAEDLCARFGGEEFALVLVETDQAGAVAAAERARAAVAGSPFRFESALLWVTASAGVATTCGGTGTTPADLLRAADRRLYAAKTLGRDRVVGEERVPAASGARPPDPESGCRTRAHVSPSDGTGRPRAREE
jgi:diguanylate cyclase (GGDEF)-like protein